MYFLNCFRKGKRLYKRMYDVIVRRQANQKQGTARRPLGAWPTYASRGAAFVCARWEERRHEAGAGARGWPQRPGPEVVGGHQDTAAPWPRAAGFCRRELGIQARGYGRRQKRDKKIAELTAPPMMELTTIAAKRRGREPVRGGLWRSRAPVISGKHHNGHGFLLRSTRA